MIVRHAPFFLFHTPFMLLGTLFWLILFAVLIGFLVRRFTAQGTPPPFGYRPGGPMPTQPPFQPPFPPFPQPSAMEILRQRYARGEIDAATYEQMRERLGGSEQSAE